MSYRGRNYKKSNSSAAAMRHIAEAAEFSSEVGGVDSDIKSYFFSLDAAQIASVMKDYRRHYGAKPADYAEETLSSWKSGRVKMSGLVAKRLFDLLPNKMPLASKYSLVESLWKVKSPSSSATLYIGPDAQNQDIQIAVSTHFQKVLTEFYLPDLIVNRFRWLAEGDVTLQQTLQNHYLNMEREVVKLGLANILPTLADHASRPTTVMLERKLLVGKNELKLVFSPHAVGISSSSPSIPQAPVSVSDIANQFGCLIIIGIIVLIWILTSLGS
jgi:hypothetical protein